MRTNTQTKERERTWFAGITDLDQLKDIYRALALAYHPDRGGDTAIMQDINAQYDQARKQLEAPAPGRKYSPPQPQPKTNNQLSHEAIIAANIVSTFCPGCWADIRDGEVIALGQTYENREKLKALGFWWSPELRAWHFVKRPGTGRKGAV